MSHGLDQSDLQGNILCGYGDDYAEGAHVFVSIHDASAARAWLAGLADRVTTAESWAGPKPDSTLNVAISCAGLRALGVPEEDLKTFPEEFRDGMAAQAARLRDHGDDAPDNWERHLNDSDAHVVISVHVHVKSPHALDAAILDLHPPAGVCVLQTQRTAKLEGGREHFGYSDGLAQPSIAGEGLGPWHGHGTPGRGFAGRRRWQDIALGEFVLGYADEDEVTKEYAAPFGRNASFMVVRKLEQDVAAWHRQLLEWTGSDQEQADRLGAQIIGRWQNGTPVALSPGAPDERLDHPELMSSDDDRKRRFDLLNDFSYGKDPGGARCPVGSHVRRANPRDAMGDGRLARRHRIIRRGMPYGKAPADSLEADDTQRGLFFLCFQASIRRQFELIQRDWLQDGDAFGLGSDRDVLISPGPEGGKMAVPGRPTRFYAPHARTVTLRGGGYFLVPSISALKSLDKA